MPIIKLNNSIIKLNNSIIFNKDKDPNVGLIYETDFSNFDVNTGLDIPLYGKPLQYSTYSNVEKTTRTINGETLSCMHMKSTSELVASLPELTDYECFSVEFFTNKDSFQGLTCGCYVKIADHVPPICPLYNCWLDTRGLGINYYSEPVGTFYSTDWGMTSDSINRTAVTNIISGGCTIYNKQKLNKAFLCGYKAAVYSIRSLSYYDIPYFCVYSDNNYKNTQMNVFRIKIYKDVDLFSQMQ